MSATCLIEVLTRRTFERASDEAFIPGQHEVDIMDPRPHRDRADMAAVLTYVDEHGRACDVLCFRYRDERGWKSIKVTRGTPKKYERGTAVGAPELAGGLLAVLEAAAEGVEPWSFEEPDEDEKAMRRMAHALIDSVERTHPLPPLGGPDA